MTETIAGTISVKAVLETSPDLAKTLYVNPKKRSRDIAYLIALAKQNHIPVEFNDAAAMAAKADKNGGVILETKLPQPVLFSQSLPAQSLCVYVSGVEDPYNLGSICRSLYAAGASMLIVQQRDWSRAFGILLRSSAGAWLRMPVVYLENEDDLLVWANQNQLPLYCASRDEGAKPLFSTSLPQNCLLAIGGAMRGLSSALLHAPGEHVYIPYGREFRNALDSVSAAAVMGFAWLKDNPHNMQ